MSDRKRVLLLESDEGVRMELEWALNQAGFDAVTTEEFSEAVDLLYSRDFDLVLVGEQPQPQRAGELLRLMREMRCPLDSIALLPETAAEARDIPRLGFWSRPLEPWREEILKVVGLHYAKRATPAAA